MGFFTAEKPKLKPDTFKKLRDLIQLKTGIFFADNKKYLMENRLFKRLDSNSCKSFEEYYELLMFSPHRFAELKHLFDSVTTNETSFFRYMPQIDAYEKKILPEIVQRKAKGPNKTIRILSAACSTGEEPYTLAMLIDQNRLKFPGIKFEIFGCDISSSVLKSCQAGIYNSNALRNTPLPFVKKYFKRMPTGLFELSPTIRRMVQFRSANIVDSEHIKFYRNMDIIFCRNVLIYFDDKTKKQVINNLYSVLQPESYLFVGHSESLHSISRAFKLVNLRTCMVYKK